MVLITITRFMDKNNVTNIFIANLSIGDILVILFCLPFRVNIIFGQIDFLEIILKVVDLIKYYVSQIASQALNKIGGIWWFPDELCKAIWMVYYTSLMVSSFTQTAMAMERSVCLPV